MFSVLIGTCRKHLIDHLNYFFLLGEFKKFALDWQTSPWCLVAGILGTVSSEMSVYTLTVITLERFYVITHTMQLDKRLSLRRAGKNQFISYEEEP